MCAKKPSNAKNMSKKSSVFKIIPQMIVRGTKTCYNMTPTHRPTQTPKHHKLIARPVNSVYTKLSNCPGGSECNGHSLVGETFGSCRRKVYLCKPRVTWDEVGLYLDWTWRCGSLTLFSRSFSFHVSLFLFVSFSRLCFLVQNNENSVNTCDKLS